MLGRVHHVGHHRAGSGQLACTASIEHHVAQHVSLGENRVEHAVHAVERMHLVDQEGRYHGEELSVLLLAHGQQLHGPAQLFRVLDILRRDLCDAFRVNILKIYLAAADQGGQDGDLPAGVVAFHIRLRIALRVALCLGVLKRRVEINAAVAHFRQNIIGRPV